MNCNTSYQESIGYAELVFEDFCGNLEFKEKRVILSEIFVWTLEDLLRCLGIASPTEEQPESKPLLLTGFIHGKIPACWSSTATFSLSP